jgi:hypothetical protein
MATRYVFMPAQASFPASAFAALGQEPTTRHMVVAFDDTTSESAYLAGVARAGGYTGALTLVLKCMMASATSGAVVMAAAVEAVTPGDTTDLDTTESFDTANNSSAVSVPAVAGRLFDVSITLTNTDTLAAGDHFRIKLSRLPADAGDTATGDCKVLSAELRDTA